MRWTSQRKAAFIRMFGNLNDHERSNILLDNSMSEEEFLSWKLNYQEKGLRGLKVSIEKPHSIRLR